ncbi:glycine amidinotransferase-like protein [Leptotrombidium deliense]|uniref:Glycine amidinotransferase n=1 Tax=Leptotrombidium deliense TaxID=299467 RepID=A0A443SSG1_9ACAR|nr:glycine amidinotransferase-like protein [Leptotrombidium deliense]
MDKPLVNSWTEFGDLELICVGTAKGSYYPEKEPVYTFNVMRDEWYDSYVVQPTGQRPKCREILAEKQLDALRDLLEGESISVTTVTEFEKDIKEDMLRKRSVLTVNCESEDKRVKKKKINTIRPAQHRFNHLISTPWFRNYYQMGLACPRDMVITMGNTIVESATACRHRYFESSYYRDIIYKFYNADKRVHWKTGPQPTCADSMFRYYYQDKKEAQTNHKHVYETALAENEVAFEAADMLRIGKDVFYKRSATANFMGLEWLRREFPELRFHMMHFKDDLSPHIDVNIIPMRPPTSGSDGIVIVNQIYASLCSQIKLFTDNNWKPIFAPKPSTSKLSPVAMCSDNLNMNALMLNTKCCVIEECEVEFYKLLEDLGFDVITCDLRALNEFGGGPHCVTWDIRRDDYCKDYFPNQNYASECKIDYNVFNDTNWYCPKK